MGLSICWDCIRVTNVFEWLIIPLEAMVLGESFADISMASTTVVVWVSLQY